MEKQAEFISFSKVFVFGKKLLKLKTKPIGEGSRPTKLFYVYMTGHLILMYGVASYVYSNFTKMTSPHLTELSGNILAMSQSFIVMIILIQKYQSWRYLVDTMIDERKSVVESDDEWQLTLDYCKKEFRVGMGCVLLTVVGCWVAFSANFFIQINSYRLPLNYYYIPLTNEIVIEFFHVTIQLKWLINAVLTYFGGICFTTAFTLFFPLCLVLMDQTCLYVDTAILLTERLDQMLMNDDILSKRTEAEKRLKRIVETTLRAQDWIAQVQGFLQFYFFVEFTNLGLICCMCIYTLSTDPLGSASILMGTYLYLGQLFVFCWVGTRVTIRIEKLSAALYDTKWYLLDAELQKHLQLIIVRMQNMKAFDGVFSALDMETFQAVMRFGYSAFSILRSTNKR